MKPPATNHVVVGGVGTAISLAPDYCPRLDNMNAFVSNNDDSCLATTSNCNSSSYAVNDMNSEDDFRRNSDIDEVNNELINSSSANHDDHVSPMTKSNRRKRKADLSISLDNNDDSDFDVKRHLSSQSSKIRKTNGQSNSTRGGRSRASVDSTIIKTEISTTVKKEKIASDNSHNQNSSKKTARSTTSVSTNNKNTSVKNSKSTIKNEPTTQTHKKQKSKQKEEEIEVWRWWEEKKHDDGRKWTTLCHNGPVFADPYQRLPSNVKFYYDGNPILLSEAAEEAMTFYSKMINHDYTKKALFNKNFMEDWRSMMSSDEKCLITDLAKCDFTEVNAYFEKRAEERKNMTKEDKKAIKEANEQVKKKFGFCYWDNHRQPVGNYKIEPPGLFRGRGEHPKQGCIKRRIMPEDVIINCDKRTKPPEPPEGHRWKEVRYDNKVSWLATWIENIMGNNKYIMLNPSARVKAERDWQKYEKARKLHKIVDQIREQYRLEWRSREMRIRQRAVALYFIDHLALRVGNEKEEDEADTVGCCSLRYEHIKLHDHLPDFGDNVVEFDFLGKDSIRYHNFVAVEIRVFKNLRIFLENKTDGDDLFDRVTTTHLNQYLNELMPGLSAKVFRTYNASKTLQDQLDELTNPNDTVEAKLLSYNRANREVAILCNHQRSIPKTFDVSMEKLKAKIDTKKVQIKELKKECKKKEIDYKNNHSITAKKEWDKKKAILSKLKEQLTKLQIQATDKEENKQIALSTSKLNYLDPRISVAWCKRHSVPIEKIYSKTQRDKFMWAMHMAEETFHFHKYQGEIEVKEEEALSNNSQNDEAQYDSKDRDDSEDQDEEEYGDCDD
ncbi:hypothetical protein GJ496_011121 [Pomphorhynchus laevis]|nr:hypothetical protein GJ496_011121 [Pomphorhynchus laevis]